jgi:hypothetical protein
VSSEKHTGGIDLEGAAELWGTPRATDAKCGTEYTENTTGKDLAKDVTAAMELWQTPAVDSFRSRGGDRKEEMGLDQQAGMQWVTPASRDYKGANSETHCTETGGGRKHMDQLSNQVEHSFLPAQQTETPGETSSESAPTSPRRLNPKFVEWLMGMPEGWTSPEPINSEHLETWYAACRERLLSLRSSTGDK